MRNTPAASTLVLLAALALAAAPLAAGTVYVSVPLADDGSFRTEVTIANGAVTPNAVSTVFLETAKDGSQDRPGPANRTIAGRSSVQLTGVGPAGKTGLLELTGPSELVVDARVAARLGGQEDLGAPLPVISSENAAAPNGEMFVQGLVRSAARKTTLVVVNLGSTASQCVVSPFRFDGTAIAAPAQVGMPPASQRVYADTLGAFGATSIDDARISVSCNQRFYAYAVVVDAAKPAASVHLPAMTFDSALLPPGSGCPPGATCFLLPGNFFTSTEADPMRIYQFAVPSGKKFKRLEMSFKFHHNGWPHNAESIYTLFYINRNGKFRGNTYAVVDISAGAERVHLEMTADLPNAGPPRGVQDDRQKVALVPGTTYDVRYTYDAENRRYHLVMTDPLGNNVVDLAGDIRAAQTRVVSKGSFWIQFSEPFGTSIHRPSIGWGHSNLVFALIP